MAQHEMYVIVPSAFEAGEAFAKILTEKLANDSVTASVTTNIGSLNFTYGGFGKDIRNNPSFQAFIEKVKDRPHLECSSAVIDINPNTPGQRTRVCLREQNTKNESIPNFRFEHSENPDIAIRLADGLHEFLHASTRAEKLEASLPAAERELVRYRHQVLANLEAQVATIGQFVLEQTKRNAAHLQDLTSELERKFQDREKTLNDRVNSQQKELEAKQKDLEAEKAAFDDRDRTHVRRELLNKLNKIIEEHKKSVSISPDTNRKRRITHAICIVMMAIGGTLMFFFGKRTLEGTEPDWRFIAPFITGTLMLATTAIYYLRWNNTWFSELARAEFANRKFEADVTRASWIAELFFEYKDERGSPLPVELLESLTASLFQNVDQYPQPRHPLEQVFDSMRRVDSVKVGSGSIEISGKGKAK